MRRPRATGGGVNPQRNPPSIRTIMDNWAAMRPLCRIAVDTSLNFNKDIYGLRTVLNLSADGWSTDVSRWSDAKWTYVYRSLTQVHVDDEVAVGYAARSKQTFKRGRCAMTWRSLTASTRRSDGRKTFDAIGLSHGAHVQSYKHDYADVTHGRECVTTLKMNDDKVHVYSKSHTDRPCDEPQSAR